MLLKITCTVIIINSVLILSGSIPSVAFNETTSPGSVAYVRDCTEVKAMSLPSGVYEVLNRDYSETPFKARCDSETHGGGWTVILRRYDGSEFFFLNWNSYKIGFGKLEGEFFMGLEKIYNLTSKITQELLVVLEDQDGIEKYELYDTFAIGDEKDKYRLSLGTASGTAGDGMELQRGEPFATLDQQYDRKMHASMSNCTELRNGGWWYNECHDSHLTGPYKKFWDNHGITWTTFRGKFYSLKKAAMMIRPKN